MDTDNRQIVSQESETKRNKPVLVILILMAITLALVSYYYWNQNRNYVITDDARVDGNIIKVSPQVTGKIVEIAAEEKQYLNENDLIARQSDTALAYGSNIDLTMIKAPISGTVIKKIAHAGEMGVPGSAVVMMANLDELYITANVEEDELVHIKEGQKVEYTVDSFPGRKFSGQVISIGEAANSVFSLLPAQNTGNSYVKITQRVPVKISINESYGLKLLPGMSAVVKIHIR